MELLAGFDLGNWILGSCGRGLENLEGIARTLKRFRFEACLRISRIYRDCEGSLRFRFLSTGALVDLLSGFHLYRDNVRGLVL